MPTAKRKICVVSGTRADYGHLLPLLREIKKDPMLELQLTVTGMHLAPEFGLTYKNIEKDGFKITEKIEMLLSSDTDTGIAKSTGLGLICFADCFDKLKPDIVVVLGDRFELLAAATAAYICRIPIAHIHGGEVTAGCFDEGIRHSISKMASVHFVSCERHAKRLRQMGEPKERIFNYGAPGLDNIKNMKMMSKREWKKAVGITTQKTVFLITYHPVTLENKNEKKRMDILLNAAGNFDAEYIITMPNADTDNHGIAASIKEFADEKKEHCRVFVSMGQKLYFSSMKYADIMIGNSSSGLIEAPSFGLPTVNIGDRQRGRERAANVFDCSSHTLKSISNTIKKALQKGRIKTRNPYGEGNSAPKIKEKLKTMKLGNQILKKEFADIN